MTALTAVLLALFLPFITTSVTSLQTKNLQASFVSAQPIPAYASIQKPTLAVTPLPILTPTPIPTIRPRVLSRSNQASFLDQINNYRRSQGLSSVRAQEITSGFNHDGFNNRINSRTLPYPSYSSDWINSSSHAANLRADTPYVCVQSSGNYYAHEGWKL